MSLTCFIIDDEYHSIEILRGYIEQTPGLKLVGTSVNPVTAIQQITVNEPPMLTFLDVDMPELSGIEVAGIIKEYTHIVFTTGHRGYAFQAFENDANDYLLKPITYQRFLKSIIKMKKILDYTDMPVEAKHPAESGFFYIKTEVKGKMQRVVINDVLYVEGAQNYVILHLLNGNKIIAYLTMGEVEASLPADTFSRIHKSYLVNNRHIKILEHGQITLENNVSLPLGRTYKDTFLTKMKMLLVASKRNG